MGPRRRALMTASRIHQSRAGHPLGFATLPSSALAPAMDARQTALRPPPSLADPIFRCATFTSFALDPTPPAHWTSSCATQRYASRRNAPLGFAFLLNDLKVLHAVQKQATVTLWKLATT